MQIKLKHKMTFDSQELLAADVTRSNRKTKTVLRSFRGVNKELSPFDLSSSVGSNQKQMKTLVEAKIEELHSKMKNFFSNERKTHLQQIAPQMQELKATISELKEQLSRPKSMQEIEQQKHSILKRKVILLQQIEQTNKKVKQNKNHFYQLKFECEQLDRQLKNGYATIQKYKRKLQLEQQNNKTPKILVSQTQQVQQNNGQMQKILNDSLCEESQPIKFHQDKQINQYRAHKTEQNTKQQTDQVHITQVSEQYPYLQNKISTQKLPAIDKVHTTKAHTTKQSTYFSNTPQPQNANQSKNLQYIKRTISMTPNHFLKKKKSQLQYVYQKQNTEASRHPHKKSNTSFDEYLRNYTIPTIQDNSQLGMQKNLSNLKSSKKDKFTLDLSMHIKKYEQLANKQKWNKINSLFDELESTNPKDTISSNKENTSMNESKNSLSITQLQELLMQQLRKEQFQSFKQKGYHEGLKDKTHQIRIQIKRIFKNFSSDDFFSAVMNKKPIKKQLSLILQNSLQ